MKIILNCRILTIACIFSIGATCPLFGADNIQHESNGTEAQKKDDVKVQIAATIVLKPKEVKKFDLIEKVQQEYIDKLDPNYRLLSSIYIKSDNNRFIEFLLLMGYNNECKLVEFDMTDVYKNLKKKDSETKKKIEDLEKIYMVTSPEK